MTEVYKTFVDQFEGHMERFVKEVNPDATVEDLVNGLKDSTSADADFIIQLILSVGEYKTFVDMIRHYKEHGKEMMAKKDNDSP